MDSLQNKLKATQRKRASDAVWAANDAVQFVLNEFRKQVQADSLPVSEGADPYYTFKVSELVAPANATFKTSDWGRQKNYVLDIMTSSTGMKATWVGEGFPIELRVDDGSDIANLFVMMTPFAFGEDKQSAIPFGSPRKAPASKNSAAKAAAAAAAHKRQRPVFGDTETTNLAVDGYFGFTAKHSTARHTPTRDPPPCVGPAVSPIQCGGGSKPPASSRSDNVAAEPAAVPPAGMAAPEPAPEPATVAPAVVPNDPTKDNEKQGERPLTRSNGAATRAASRTS